MRMNEAQPRVRNQGTGQTKHIAVSVSHTLVAAP
jgi:hypothetical protein